MPCLFLLFARSSKYIIRTSRALSRRSSNASRSRRGILRALSRRSLRDRNAGRETRMTEGKIPGRDEKGVFPAERRAGISVSPTIESLSYNSTCRRGRQTPDEGVLFPRKLRHPMSARPPDNIDSSYLKLSAPLTIRRSLAIHYLQCLCNVFLC